MQEDILRLIELQKLDLEILKYDRAIEYVPENLKKAKNNLDKIKEKLDKTIALIEEKEGQKKLFEEELQEETKRLKQTQARLNQIRGTREYQILLGEIEEIKRTNKQKEEEILKLMEEIENLTQEKNKLEEELQKLNQIYEEEKRKYQELCQRLNEEKSHLLVKRKQMTSRISSKILQRYETLRQKKGGIGIAGVVNAICEGCHMAIPPQLYIEIQKDNRFYECPYCKRLIYFKPYYEEEGSSSQEIDQA